ncbi:MAG: T9SS type A sorting domain-containing protein [Bacteroidales bacterium]|nr:T9SS type A sorting domain-containing protein [Bacteroidales bacterium]
MKKFLLFTFILLYISSGINAQSIKLIKEDGSEIANDSLFITADNTEDLIEVPVYVKNLTDATLDVVVKKYEPDIVSGSEAYFCWDNCYPNTTFQSSGFLTANPNDTIKDFSGDFKPFGNTGISKVMYTFFKNKEEADSASVTIYYEIVTVGIKEVNVLKQSISCYPNPVTDNVFFKYKLEPNSKGEIHIFDLTGKKVKQKTITSSEDNLQINVSDLNTGMYLWTIVVDGVPVKSEKLIKR